MSEGKYTGLTKQIIGAFYAVYNCLGYGFLEKVYENALAIELKKRGLRVVQQKPISVYYAGQLVGEYFADMVVNDLIIAELKAVSQLGDEHEAQLLNYLKATTIEVGLLFNADKHRSINNNLRHLCSSVSHIFFFFTQGQKHHENN